MKGLLGLALIVCVCLVNTSAEDETGLSDGPQEVDDMHGRIGREASENPDKKPTKTKQKNKGKNQTNTNNKPIQGKQWKKKNLRRRKKQFRNKKRKITKKIKLYKKKKPKQVKEPETRQQEEEEDQCTARGTVPDECLKDAMEVLLWETYQVNNFMRQFKRYGNFHNTTMNKKNKKNQWNTTMIHMESAVGGNMDAISCTSSDSAKLAADFKSTYETLSKCSAQVEARCNIQDPPEMANMTSCFTKMDAIKPFSDACRALTGNSAAQCACWSGLATKQMVPIKGDKCNGAMTTMVRKMKADKNDCIGGFTDCKKAEDASIALVYACQHFGEGENWNKELVSGVKADKSTWINAGI